MSQRKSCGGVQPWSVGEIYPYHIVVVGLPGKGGYVFAQGPSGKLMEHYYLSRGRFNPVTKRMEGGDFKDAHAKAEANARRQLHLDRQDAAPKVAV
jgi:hypothetical protein